MFADPNAPLVNPFEVGDSATKSLRVNVVGGGAAGGTSSNFGAVFPASGTAAGAIDSFGNMAGLNLDALGQLKVVLPAAGGGLTDAQLRASAVPVSVASLPLPAGAATEATLATRLADATFTARINTLGQKAMAASTPVVLASDQSAIPVTGTFFQATQPISAVALPLPTGAATEATLATRLADATFTGRFPAAAALADAFANPTVTHIGSETMLYNGTTWDRARGTIANGMAVDVTRVQGNVAITAAALPLPAGAATEATLSAMSAKLPAALVGGRLDTNIGAWLGSAAPTVGQKAMASSVPVVIASDQSAIPVVGDVDHDAVNTLKQIQIAGNARAVDDAPAAVSAADDRVRLWLDRFGSPIVRTRKIRSSYTAVFRLAEAAARLDQTFTQVANTDKQWATLHHTAAAARELRLLKCWGYITSDTVAGIQGVIELRELSVTTPPATGNPAITPRPHRIGTGAAEATALYLPTTQGSEAAVNSPLGHIPFDTGISGAVSTVNPVPILVPFVLYDAATEDPELMAPTAPVGVYGGWAAMIRTVGAPVLRVTIFMRLVEEIP